MLATPKIDFVYFDAGGGHRSAATALQSVIAAEGYGWDIRLVNLQEVLDPLDVFRKITGIRLQDLYNRMLARGLTWGAGYWLPLMQEIIRLYHRPSVRLLTGFWRSRHPDMVVSLVPNLNRALFESLELACPGTPYITILTDLADYPPHFWMEKQEQYFICGTPYAVGQAERLGASPARVIGVSGMILRPHFYEDQRIDRAGERRRLGLNESLPTGLVLFGGEGSNVMFSVAERLGNSDIDLQLIMLCGRNKKLIERLKHLQTRNKIYVEGFTKQVPYFMRLADFFIGKPGPGSISEALHTGLPVIVESNNWTLPQERYNARWLREKGYGIVLGNLREIEGVVRDLIAGGLFPKLKEKISSVNNRAVYEIPLILQRILNESRRGAKPELQATDV
ncbi:MAG: glycosyltransferase [Bryobacteraceae bacterium]